MKKLILPLCCMLAMGCAAVAPSAQPVADDELRAELQRADRALREARLLDAEVIYRRLAKSNPRLPEVWLRLGNIYVRQAQLEAAVRVYLQGLKYGGDDGRIWYNLAIARLKQSMQTLETAATVLPPDNPYYKRIRQLHASLLYGAPTVAENTGASRPRAPGQQ